MKTETLKNELFTMIKKYPNVFTAEHLGMDKDDILYMVDDMITNAQYVILTELSVRFCSYESQEAGESYRRHIA